MKRLVNVLVFLGSLFIFILFYTLLAISEALTVRRNLIRAAKHHE